MCTLGSYVQTGEEGSAWHTPRERVIVAEHRVRPQGKRSCIRA